MQYRTKNDAQACDNAKKLGYISMWSQESPNTSKQYTVEP